MIIETLRGATQKNHRELDQVIFPIIQLISTRKAYIDLLYCFYGFFKPVQDSIDRYLNDEYVAGYSGRRKPGRLLEDMGEEYFSGTFCTEVPVITTTAAAFGAYYVLEGSTMGGSIISKRIAANLGLQDHQSLSFLMGYGENNRVMWNTFLLSMEQQAFDAADTKLLVDSARYTFIAFKRWAIKYYGDK